ncbi:polysaccharide biosynthesis/export family protein [Rubinisphaera brasiliensis]|uniref:Polysaccharide biosynthesis protein n=1 Tax=Rubinisphaera brasiliensis (strain ATCC 49424 / DSM 5305 / JCM 21570 / IAM 15109 / NBRC 103401 / IFAM 1448) TaxID=756272 RepID=F0SI69_RUBBR|nr:polysaccharide biosynthesis/export family protein [Rubinisphaera brasiliensis]ADY61771.1 polysaccharide biosynthesis protein [Rubinisphaera brasiliensis DSM 5305]
MTNRIFKSLFCCTILTMVGCAAYDIPAVPAYRVPASFLGRGRESMQELSLNRLGQGRPIAYQLAPGDILGVYIEFILGDEESAPPVHFPEAGDQPPAIGYPIPVREDGTLALPLIDPLPVEGLTLEQATEKIRRVYVEKEILQRGKDKVIVTLMRRREYRVIVIREEGGGVDGVTKVGRGDVIDLPAYENDVLHALNETGGLPGLDAENEVLILRAGGNGAKYDQFVGAVLSSQCPCECPPIIGDAPNVTRIPIRYYPENVPAFGEKDVLLETGDIVYVRARETERYYTGGLLGGGEFMLPRDYDLDVIKAISVAGGSVGQGSTGIGSLTNGGGFGGGGGGNRGMTGGTIGPSKLIVIRKNECGQEIPIRVNLNKALYDPRERILVMPGDTLILQYTLSEEIANAALNAVGLNLLWQLFQDDN